MGPRNRVLVRGAALASAALLVFSACGTRVAQERVEQADPAMGGPAAPQGGAPAAQGTGRFGTIASPCGPGDASGATDVGVTDEEITIVAVADPGGLRPGLNQGVHDSMKAFGEWCNAQGGINGRRVNVVLRDARLLEYQPQVQFACDNALALVGGIAVLDDTGAQTQVDCGLPNIPAAAVSVLQTEADFTYQPMPNPAMEWSIGSARWIAERHPDAIRRGAIIRTRLPVTEVQSDRQVEAYRTVGFDFRVLESANIGEANWGPLVLRMKNEDIDYMTMTSSYEEMVKLQQEMQLQGFEPEVIELEANFYNAKYPVEAGPAANGTLVRLTVWPFEEADENPAMRTYLDALEAAVPGSAPELLGVQAWSAALLWATVVKELGSQVTRQGLLEGLARVRSWDGGGLHGTNDPGVNHNTGCFIMMEVSDGGFRRVYPTREADAEVFEQGRGFACPADSVVELQGDYGQGARAR